MKHKKKIKRLEAKIKAYEQTVSRKNVDSKGFKKPGSLNKS